MRYILYISVAVRYFTLAIRKYILAVRKARHNNIKTTLRHAF